MKTGVSSLFLNVLQALIVLFILLGFSFFGTAGKKKRPDKREVKKSEILTAAFLVPLFTAGVRMSVPLIFGSVGDVVSERSGVMNIGLEGEMLVSALISFMAAYHTGSLFLGILAGGMAGLAGALLIAFWGVSRKQDQSVVGIMFNIFALGFTNFLYRAVYGVSTDKIKVDILKNIEIPLLSKIPFIGDIFFKHNLLVYCAFAAAAVVWFLLRYTNLG